ncbi:hypothetical protein [Gimesia chilikensis]|uniref:hypothetical protein n=1 Tax=Gimesia chilikensis TaxID=2605989 RepID=UPI003A959001
MSKYGFLEQGTFNWIINQCRKVDKLTGSRSSHARSRTVISNSGFWAEITNVNLSNGKCSWQKLKPQAESEFSLYDAPLIAEPDWDEGLYTDDEGYAYEINGSNQIVKHDKVWLMPSNEGYYFFEYKPEIKIAQATDDIAKRNNDIINFSYVRLYETNYTDSYTNTLSEVDFTQYIKVFNMSSSADVGKDKYIMIAYVGGWWQVVFEDC